MSEGTSARAPGKTVRQKAIELIGQGNVHALETAKRAPMMVVEQGTQAKLMDRLGRRGKCDGPNCGIEVWWIEDKGKPYPYTLEGRNHFVDCPDADRFRNPVQKPDGSRAGLQKPDDSHECPVRGCVTPVPDERLMCLQHWRKVPKDVQDQVYRTWSQRKAAPRYAPAVQAHVQACADAVQSVNDQLADRSAGQPK